MAKEKIDTIGFCNKKKLETLIALECVGLVLIGVGSMITAFASAGIDRHQKWFKSLDHETDDNINKMYNSIISQIK